MFLVLLVLARYGRGNDASGGGSRVQSCWQTRVGQSNEERRFIDRRLRCECVTVR